MYCALDSSRQMVAQAHHCAPTSPHSQKSDYSALKSQWGSTTLVERLKMIPLLSLVPKMSPSLLPTMMSPTFKSLRYTSLLQPAHFLICLLPLMMNCSMSYVIHPPSRMTLPRSMFFTMAMTISRHLRRNCCFGIKGFHTPTLKNSISTPEIPNGSYPLPDEDLHFDAILPIKHRSPSHADTIECKCALCLWQKLVNVWLTNHKSLPFIHSSVSWNEIILLLVNASQSNTMIPSLSLLHNRVWLNLPTRWLRWQCCFCWSCQLQDLPSTSIWPNSQQHHLWKTMCWSCSQIHLCFHQEVPLWQGITVCKNSKIIVMGSIKILITVLLVPNIKMALLSMLLAQSATWLEQISFTWWYIDHHAVMLIFGC